MKPHAWRVRTRILLALVSAMALSIIVIAATIFYTFNAVHSDYKALLEDKAFALSENIRRIMNQNLTAFPLDGMNWMNDYLYGVAKNNADISYAFIADKNRKVLYHSDEKMSGAQLNEPSYDSIQYDTIFKRLMFPVNAYYEVIMPVIQSDQIIGTIHIGLKRELIDSKIFGMVVLSSTVLVLAWGMALALIYAVLQRHVIRPMTALADKAAQISQHRDLTQRIAINSDDEIGVLSASFNAMIESLRQYYDDLETKVRERTAELQDRNEQLNSEIRERERLEASLRIAKEEAEIASRTKSEFLARMSHEIRTPMNAILGMSELLFETPLNTDQKDYIHTLQSSGELLLSIINDILDFSKIESGQIQLEATSFNLVALIDEVGRIMMPRARENGLNLACWVAPGIYPDRIGDPTRLRQILLNLVGNAVKFTAHGAVMIDVADVEEPGLNDALRFSVRDTGIGIAPEQHAAVFESFFQADASITRKYGGSGLGLAICRRLVELMGGRIGLNSELGRGSEFFFIVSFARVASVPSQADAAPEPASLHSGSMPLPAARVLLVEDSAANRKVICKFLQGSPLTISEAVDGREAVAKATTEPFDLILMDVEMPEMDGLEATRRIRAWERETGARPVTIATLTAHALDEHRQRCYDAGCDAFLTKPVRKGELWRALGELLAARAAGSTASAPVESPVPQVAAATPPGLPVTAPAPAVGTAPPVAMTANARRIKVWLDQFLSDLLPEFLTELEEERAAMRRALAGADFADLRRRAHGYKGAAGNYGLTDLADLFLKLEQAAKATDADAARASLAVVDEYLSRLDIDYF